jgi:glutamate-5-semialdehyde dehydrogenase
LQDLPELCRPLTEKEVIVYADEPSFRSLDGNYSAELLKRADEESFGTEFLDYKMAVKTVYSLEEAFRHIEKFGSKHSECIVTENENNSLLFAQAVDAACVYTNVSTAFTDGAQFGLGAEIGISTQKLHARGPMGLSELCTYKWIITGEGQIRS